ncbi:type I-E CRISPR-associated protein Cas6/Cse3/CasE [Streptomyces sp. ISL-99]|uniref:type I-E CRISPR-associated protein Cas6/Cse3/CasE n=1 Tax=Streptomyces sp. ISL-99 TaxID=2819193 RepID=UPI001BECD664|nr:type I-E CRISPR-associated protein Cas6/Cse3/CasE [Streptomyces sp. ISL-99]MBT2530135.1 type I-E CRISPR-associated protein Cas6/Cse3/CasE [Streptomyces sp. ISL-99]
MTHPTLTRIALNPHHKAVRTDLADAVSLHKTLMRLVPDGLGPSPRAAAGLLFRLEQGCDPVLLIQTSHRPVLTRLPTHYGIAQSRDLAPLLQALTTGLAVRYRITAAPTAALSATAVPHPETGRRRGKITALTGDDAIAWWQRRAATAGLDILTVATADRPFNRKDRSRPGPYDALMQFDGTARVTDPHQLRTSLHSGIGRAKPYGAGLLSLAPA